MVTVVDYHCRENKDGEEFFTLELRGDLEMVQSQNTGKFYATTKRCSIVSTFDESVCEMMVGKTMPGTIVKVDVEPYEYAIPESGEVVKLAHRWEFAPESVRHVEPAMEKAVFQ
ncbi:MAG: hypothetical protein ACPGLV_13865 [Bacteroidia bacterium]